VSYLGIPKFVGCTAVASGSQTVSNGSNDGLAMNTNVKTDGFYSIHDTVTNNTRFTAPFTGTYAMAAWVIWNAPGSSANIYALSLRLNGGVTAWLGRHFATPLTTEVTRLFCCITYKLSGGDYVEPIIAQNIVAATNQTTLASGGGYGGNGMSMVLISAS